MAGRTHGQVLVSIWDDLDFRSLPPGPQRMYLFLVSQGDLSYAGVLALRVHRWAGRAAGLDDAQVERDLAVLIDRRYVVIDEDSEELLIRTFIRNDGLWRQPRMMSACARAVREVESVRLRAALLAELRRLPVDELPTVPTGRAKTGPSVRDQVAPIIADVITGLEAANPEEPTPPQPLARASSGPREALASPSSGADPGPDEGLSRAPAYVTPFTPHPSPHTFQASPAEPAPPPPAAHEPPEELDLLGPLARSLKNGATTTGLNRRAQDLARGYVALVPMSRFPAVMGIAKKAIEAGHADDAVAAALERLAAEGRSLTVETLRVELEGQPPPRGRRSTTERVTAGLALAARLDQENPT